MTASLPLSPEPFTIETTSPLTYPVPGLLTVIPVIFPLALTLPISTVNPLPLPKTLVVEESGTSCIV